MTEPEKPDNTATQNELIELLKDLQAKLKASEAKSLCEFYESMKSTIDTPEKIKTDNPKFNEFIKKFTNDSLASEDSQKISKKLMMAFLYINTD